MNRTELVTETESIRLPNGNIETFTWSYTRLIETLPPPCQDVHNTEPGGPPRPSVEPPARKPVVTRRGRAHRYWAAPLRKPVPTVEPARTCRFIPGHGYEPINPPAPPARYCPTKRAYLDAWVTDGPWYPSPSGRRDNVLSATSGCLPHNRRIAQALDAWLSEPTPIHAAHFGWQRVLWYASDHARRAAARPSLPTPSVRTNLSVNA